MRIEFFAIAVVLLSTVFNCELAVRIRDYMLLQISQPATADRKISSAGPCYFSAPGRLITGKTVAAH